MNEKLTRTQFDVLKYIVKYGHIERIGKSPIEMAGRIIKGKTIRSLIVQNLIKEMFECDKTIYTPTDESSARISEEMKLGKKNTDFIGKDKLDWVDPGNWKDSPVYGIQFKNGTFGTMRSRKTLDQLVKSGRYLSVKQLAG